MGARAPSPGGEQNKRPAIGHSSHREGKGRGLARLSTPKDVIEDGINSLLYSTKVGKGRDTHYFKEGGGVLAVR